MVLHTTVRRAARQRVKNETAAAIKREMASDNEEEADDSAPSKDDIKETVKAEEAEEPATEGIQGTLFDTGTAEADDEPATAETPTESEGDDATDVETEKPAAKAAAPEAKASKPSAPAEEVGDPTGPDATPSASAEPEISDEESI